MNQKDLVGEQLCGLAHYLTARRADILRAWHALSDADTELTTLSALTRSQFIDHIPAVLDAFARRLCARQRTELAEATEDQRQGAAGHGMHRWQQGYQQRELIREWRHLHFCLLDELRAHMQANRDLEFAVISEAHRALAELCHDGVCESAAQFFRLQQADAASRVDDLERAIEQLKMLDRQRMETWREAAHDLRGNLGVVKNATAILNQNVPDSVRSQFLSMLERGVGSLTALLNDLMNQARLEAGQERRQIKEFDVAVLLNELCANMEPLAIERGLFLTTSGPATLKVEGDPVKAQRIVQNLLLNALKYTEEGGVRVIWSADAQAQRPHWTVCVQDTGPGFSDGPVPPLARALKQATDVAHELENEAGHVIHSFEQDKVPLLESSSEHRRQPLGEGIGLSIVKRLCELLDATIELETAPGKGSTFRVIFPLRYS